MYDELDLDMLGGTKEDPHTKTALFLVMSDTDKTFNFLLSMIYTQLFNLLCEKADDEFGGRLPIHVRCLIDEFANSVTRSVTKTVAITDKVTAYI